MAADPAALDRLMEIGRRQGYVTVDQITQTLPISAMSEGEIARAVERLEQAGIQVEIDEEWGERRRDPDEALEIPAFPGDAPRPAPAEVPPPRPDGAGARAYAAGREEGPALAGPPPGVRRVAWLPMLAGGIALLILAVLLLGWLG
jgi:biotin operon repressor